MSVRALIERLVAQGMDPIDAAEVVTEAALLGAASTTKDAAAEKRRAYDRDRKRKSTGIPPEDNSAVSTGIPPESAASRTSAQVVTPSLPSLRSEELKIPPEKPTVSTPKGAKTRISKSRICPADWSPSDEDRAVGMAEGFTSGEIERELSKFRDHEFRDPHSHWSPTFRKWLRTAAERRPRLTHERSHPDKRATAYAERLVDIGAAMEAALQHGGGSG